MSVATAAASLRVCAASTVVAEQRRYFDCTRVRYVSHGRRLGISVDPAHPAVRVGGNPPLDVDEALPEAHGRLSRAAGADLEPPVGALHAADRGDNGSGPAGKGFRQPA